MSSCCRPPARWPDGTTVGNPLRRPGGHWAPARQRRPGPFGTPRRRATIDVNENDVKRRLRVATFAGRLTACPDVSSDLTLCVCVCVCRVLRAPLGRSRIRFVLAAPRSLRPLLLLLGRGLLLLTDPRRCG